MTRLDGPERLLDRLRQIALSGAETPTRMDLKRQLRTGAEQITAWTDRLIAEGRLRKEPGLFYRYEIVGEGLFTGFPQSRKARRAEKSRSAFAKGETRRVETGRPAAYFTAADGDTGTAREKQRRDIDARVFEYVSDLASRSADTPSRIDAAEALNLTEGQVRRALSQLFEDGRLRRIGGGVDYRIEVVETGMMTGPRVYRERDTEGCVNGHPWTEHNIIRLPGRGRACRACQRTRQSKHRAARNEASVQADPFVGNCFADNDPEAMKPEAQWRMRPPENFSITGSSMAWSA